MKHQLVILFFGLLALSFASMPGQVAADDGDIEVLEQKAESRFPEGIQFTVKARSSHEIDDIRVFFKKLGNSRGSAYRPVEFEPGLEITGVSLLSSGGLGSYFPPGTKIEYSFEIRDKSGAVHRTEKQEFVYLDNRFEWLTVTSGLITVYYYSEYVENRAEIVLEAASEALERMLPILGIAPEEPLRIVTYNNYTHMSAALPFRSQATAERLITEGMAFSDERVLLVLGSNATVKGTASHEFTHLLVGEASGRANREVPSWLSEGLAEYGNVDPTDSYDAALLFGILNGRIKPLWYLTSFGGTPEDIIIAYGHARSVVFHMIDTYGEEKMAELFRVLRQTRDLDEALMQVYGFDQYGLDTEWRGIQGMEALPPPSSLEDSLAARQTATPEPTETSAPTPPPTNTVPPPPTAAEAQPSPEPTGVPTPAASLEDTAAQPGSCGLSTTGGAGGVSPDVAMLALLAGPLALMLARPWGRRRSKMPSGSED